MKKRFRTPALEQTYQQYRASHPDASPFTDWQTRVVEEFTHWILIKNKFPWDLIAREHHMLLPRRVFSREQDMSQSERDELVQIKERLLRYYDMCVENGTLTRSVPTHYHIHFLILHDETNPEYE